jgi:hypothetical protein
VAAGGGTRGIRVNFGPEQPLACESLEWLGPRARAAAPALAASLIEHIGELHPPFEFLDSRPFPSEYDVRAVWTAFRAIAAPEQMTPVLLAALQHAEPGPRIVAATVLAEGIPGAGAAFDELWRLLGSQDASVRSSGAWAIAVQQAVPEGRIADVVTAVDWPKVQALLPRLTPAQRGRVTNLLERAVTHPATAVARLGATHYPEFHERCRELEVEETGAEK